MKKILLLCFGFFSLALGGCGRSQFVPTPPAEPPKPAAAANPDREAARQVFMKLLQALREHDEATALPMAQEILQHDPLEKGPYGMGTGLRPLAINTLISFRIIDAYLDDLNRQLAATPDSARLNLLAAEAQGRRTGRAGAIAILPAFAPPAWLKLARHGDTFTASYSADGQKWRDVFTRNVPMDSGGLIGVIASPNSLANAKIAWRDVRLSGATPPASWQYSDVGRPYFHSGAEWTGDEVTMDSPISKTAPPFFIEDYGYVYQSLAGDGDIVACLSSLTGRSDGSWAGLCFRSRTDETSPSVEFFCDRLGIAHCSVHTNSADAGIHFYKKAAELLSDNPDALRRIAMQLQLQRSPGDANAVTVSRLALRFPTESNEILDALPSFEDAHRLPDFVKGLDSLSSNDASLPQTLLRVGDELQLTGHFVEAEGVYRKALTLNASALQQEIALSYVRLLIETNHRDDAASEFAKGYTSQDSPSWLSSFFRTSIQSTMIDGWYPPAGKNRSPRIDERAIPLLQMAVGLGLYHELKPILDERAGTQTVTSGAPVDPSRVASILLSIMARDPAYRLELDKLVGELTSLPAPPPIDFPLDNHTGMVAAGINFTAVMALCAQLAKWPEERPEVLRIAGNDFHGQLGAEEYFRVRAEFEVMRAALESGDHAMAQQVLRDMNATMQKNPAVSPNAWPVDRTQIVRAMIQEGMFSEAAAILADWQNDLQVANDPAYLRKVGQIKMDLAFAQNQIPPASLVSGVTSALDPATTQRRSFFWQIGAGEKGNDLYRNSLQAYRSDVLWSETVPRRPTDYRLEIESGPDENHLTQLSTYQNAPTMGNAILEIPPGARVMKAFLFAPSSPEDKSGNPAPVADGDTIPVIAGGNLLKNPHFDISTNVQGLPVIVGWHGLLPWQVTQASGGPLPAGTYQVVEVPNDRADLPAFEVSSEPIALEPRSDYVLSAWQRDGMAPDFLFLDANGAELKRPRSLSAERHDGGWQWCTWRLAHAYSSGLHDVTIPIKAVSVQIVFGHTWKVADVSFSPTPPLDPAEP
jgi:tetratricopeptide (TPR) repeat protein